MALPCGYDDLNDHSELRSDECFQVTVGKLNTLCRLENEFNCSDAVAVHGVIFSHFIAKNKDNLPKEFILDFDATDCLIYGNQEECHYNVYYKDNFYMPLYVFCGEDLLIAYLPSK